MRIPISAAFNKWLLDQQPLYPYSSLQSTRNSIYCKWVMLRGHSRFFENFPVLANSFSNSVLLQMLQSGEAKPLPLALSQVMDDMLTWGRDIDPRWFALVIDRLALLLESDTELDKR